VYGQIIDSRDVILYLQWFWNEMFFSLVFKNSTCSQNTLQPEEPTPSVDPKSSPRLSRASVFIFQLLQVTGPL